LVSVGLTDHFRMSRAASLALDDLGLLILFLTTCGSGWLRCCHPLPNGASATPGGFAFSTEWHSPASRHVRAADRCRVARCPHGDGGLLGCDGLARAAGLDRGRRLTSPARRPASRASPRRSAGLERLLCVRGARQGSQRANYVGSSPVNRARPGSKHHLIVDRHGTQLAVPLTGGNRHDVAQLLPLLDAIPSIRGLRGRPRRNPQRLYADRGYDFDKYRRLLRKRGIKTLIARGGVGHDSGLRTPNEMIFEVVGSLRDQ